MRTIHRSTPISAVLAQPDAAAVVRSVAPEVFDSPMVIELADFPTAPILGLILGEDDSRIAEILDAVADYEDLSPRLIRETPIAVTDAYEPASTERGSALVEAATATVPLHRRAEVVLNGPSHGNPFVEVELSATFRLDEHEITVGGFYDGDGTYRIRFLAPCSGEWRFITRSNARSLDAIEGTRVITPSAARGPIRVSGEHFASTDGRPFVPIGTTAYAWTHQDDSLQEQTLRSLAESPFTKIRMGVFPKSFMFNENEPERFVFPRADDGQWDTTRFDPAFFHHLERRIDQLDELGIEADLILFHPYDRWGFATLGPSADDRYVAYVVRRLSAFVNVWWSMANEYDLITTKDREDWNRLAGIVQENDPVAHPLSIHNWVDLFDYSAGWATHCSIQRADHAIGKSIGRWKRQWSKPVIVDESGYEGDIDQGWGNLTAQEMVRRFWDATMSGGYLTHGETYASDDAVLWWSKGGTLQGESLPRLAFLREIIDASPSGRMDPLPSDWDFLSAGADGYSVTYYGINRPSYRDVRVPEGRTAIVEVIDTWAMTIDRLPGSQSGTVRVALPARPYCAIRVVLEPDEV